MKLGIDYDGTWTEAPELFQQLVPMFQDAGHDCVVVTRRSDPGNDEYPAQEVKDAIGDLCPIIFCGQKRKDKLAPDVDVWIDDNPALIVNDKAPKEESIQERDISSLPLATTGEFETGKPVTFTYVHNTEKSPRVSWADQEYEPAGFYCNQASPSATSLPNLVTGVATLQNPLVTPWVGYEEADGWKQSLSRAYGGKTGKSLTREILKDGYDGIVTVNKYGPGEIVLLDPHSSIGESMGEIIYQQLLGRRKPGDYNPIPLSEREDAEAHEYASTQVEASPAIADKIATWAEENIEEDDLAEYGVETDSHITVLYGLHDDDPGPIYGSVRNFEPFTVRLGPLEMFEAEKYDVLYISADSPELEALHDKLAELEHTNTHPEYTPHLTIAYLESGTGQQYIDEFAEEFSGEEFEVEEIIFSDTTGERTIAQLRGLEEMRTPNADRLIEQEIRRNRM